MKYTKRLMTMLAVLALALAACSPAADDGGDTTTSAAGDTTTSAAADTTTSADGDTSTTGDASALPDLEGRTVTVAVENAYLPFNFILAGETEGQGWDYDAWRDICERLNCVPEFVEAAWPAVIDQVAQGEFDTAADGISITDERKEIVDFSEPYMVVQQKFIVGLDDDRFATAQDLIDDPDATIATQVGTTNFELAAELVGEDRIQAFDQFGLAIQALIAGDVDAVIIDDAAGLGYIGENADQIKTIDDPLQSDPLGFIYPQGSDLVDPVNQAIAAMAEDGTMEELGRKWFGPDFDVTYDDIEG
jgi:polar amino acid transport system substrate-binding protein